ncbi:MAG: hypothetical protein DRQ54_02735 [Gammaproteobacteria bacterium]|nr:MAG: hypothetical protein DRQ54_02735 [Gammaproteobacteria bacterium]RLA14691.1 MAG: hypothetical protein DRQ52_03590 [Gammaproteobacteria bacterium]
MKITPLLLLITGGLASYSSFAINVTGTVTGSDGKPVEHVMISVDNGDVQPGDVTLSVFTDAKGRYVFRDLEGIDDMAVRATLGGYVTVQPESREVPLQVGVDGKVQQDFVVHEGMDAQTLPASVWMGKMPAGAGRELALLQCASCHQVPSMKMRSFAKNLAYLSEEDRISSWESMIQYMRIKVFEIGPDGSKVSPEFVDFETMMNPDFSLFNLHDEEVIAEYFGKYMPVDFSNAEGYTYTQGPNLTNSETRIHEYHLPKTSLIREIALTPASPYVWGADLQKNRLFRVDPNNPTDQVSYPVPVDGPTGPHTLNDDAEGFIWDANIEGDVVHRFNPVTEEWKAYDQFGEGSVAHDIALNSSFQVAKDINGKLWFTLIGKNKLASLDPETGEVEEFDIPMTEGNKPFRAAVYGAALRGDGKEVWFTQLTGGLGAINTETGELSFWQDYPEGKGPRRIAIDDDDNLYVTLFGSGEMDIYDTQAHKLVKKVKLPDPNAAPYSALWDRWRNVVWIGNSNADVIYRYDVATGDIGHIPLPSTHAYLRMITFDRKTGNLWTAYSHMPIGSGPSSFVMIDPGDHPKIN